MRGTEDLERLDATLASRAREHVVLRLRLGQLLEVMSRGAVFELGFSSLGAYALERCERSMRWVEGARCVARRLEALPELRRAMALGKVSWAMGELLASVASPANETRWLDLAQSRTVRQVRTHVAETIAAARAASARVGAAVLLDASEPMSAREDAAPVDATAAGDELGNLSSGEDDDICTLTCTVNREDAWLFEATRCLLDQLGERSSSAQCEALLAEGQGTLLELLPRGAIDASSAQGEDVSQQDWAERLRRWRVAAEVACEENIVGERTSAPAARVAGELNLEAVAASVGMAALEHASCVMLDRQVRGVGDALVRHELELSQLALRFQRAGGWRRLGYATEAQYARERLGLSRSSLAARRGLALRLEALPSVSAALGAAQIGVEAALQLVRVATPRTQGAWVDRARRRTIKHLREEVAAALTAVRMAGERDCPPPDDAELAAFQSLEQAVVSGRFAWGASANDVDGGGASASKGASASGKRHVVEPASDARKAWCVMLSSLASWLEGVCQISAAPPSPTGASSRACSSFGRVTLRLRMSRETCAWWRSLEAQARRWLPRGMSWLRFLCVSVWQGWRHMLGTDAAYGHIYIRDRFRCTSPVCDRRDVTPHHLQFRSAGGSDEDANVASLCTWCHLLGVHGGRIRASGTADRIRWELGPRNAPAVIVHGRDRMAA